MAITPTNDWGWQPKVLRWGDWEQSFGLRYAVPPTTTTNPPVLQSRWIRTGFGIDGIVVAVEDEWRDVPIVVVDSPHRLSDDG